MKRLWLAVTALAFGLGGIAMGCSDDEESVVSPADGGSGRDGAGTDSSSDGSLPDADTDAKADAADAADAHLGTPWLLVTMNYTDQSELIVLGLDGGASPGRIEYEGGLGLTSIDSFGRPFLLQEMLDRVVALDPAAPWQARGSWNVRLDDRADGGLDFADPVALVSPLASKAYVIRFNRNKIAVIDPTQSLDGGAPTNVIDLSSLQDPSDTDTSVDPMAAVFANGKVYVLLANLDFNKYPTKSNFSLCTNTRPKVIAIDPATDTVQPVTTGGAATGVELPGYNSLLNGMVYDALRNRLLIVESGCNDELGDAGAGPQKYRQVDAVDLTTGVASTVLDLNAGPVPTAIATVGADEVVLGFAYSEARRWTVTSTTTSPALASDLSALASATTASTASSRRPQLFAARSRNIPLDAGGVDAAADATALPQVVHDIVEVPLDGGAPAVLSAIPASRDGGVAGWIDYHLAP